MALKKHEQAQLDTMKQSLHMLVGMEINDSKVLMEKLSPMIAGFEASTKMRVTLGQSETGEHELRVVDPRKDKIESRLNPTGKLHSLRIKVLGVPIDIKVRKTDAYRFSNKEIIGALNDVANSLETLDVELHTLGDVDLVRETGQPLRIKDADPDGSDNSGDGAGPGVDMAPGEGAAPGQGGQEQAPPPSE